MSDRKRVGAHRQPSSLRVVLWPAYTAIALAALLLVMVIR